MVQKAKYLGCILNKKNDPIVEGRGRIREAMGTLKRMHVFWRHSNCNIRFKLNVVQAVLYSKVLFGLESAELQTTALKSLDVFQLKCLRKILKMKTTYVERGNTNLEVFKRANEQLKEREKIRALSEIYLERKQKFFCKVATAGNTDPIRTITFQNQWAMPREHLPRRTGRPKHKWANEECKRLWQKAQEGKHPRIPYDPHSAEQGVEIMGLAQRVMEKKKR